MLKRFIKNKQQIILAIPLALLLVLGVLIVQFFHISIPPTAQKKKMVSEGSVRAVWRFSIYKYSENKSLNAPYDVAVDNESNLYVSNTNAGEIIVFDKSGKFKKVFEGRKNSGGALHTPLGISINPFNGDIAVADKRLGKVNIYDSSFRFKKSLGEVFPIKPFFYDSKLYITTSDHVSIYSKEGRLLKKWGTRGKKWGQFDFPNGIAFSNNTVYVSDSNNHRVQAFSEKGDVVWVEGKPVESVYEKERRFDLPAGVATDEDGYIYLVDTFDCSIRLLTKDGVEIATIGDFGAADGLFRYPTSITYAGNNRFYITDRGNNRIQAIDIFARKKGVTNVVKNTGSGFQLFFEPFLAYMGFIIGSISFIILALSFLIVFKKRQIPPVK